MQNPPVMQNEFSARQNNLYSLLLLDLISMILYKHDVIFFFEEKPSTGAHRKSARGAKWQHIVKLMLLLTIHQSTLFPKSNVVTTMVPWTCVRKVFGSVYCI